MSLINNGKQIATTGGVRGGFEYPYEIQYACKFANLDCLVRTTTATVTDRDVFTVSVWVKNPTYATNASGIISAGSSSNNRGYLWHDTTGFYRVYRRDVIGARHDDYTESFHRDVSHWHHLVYQCDVTEAASADRHKFFINGVQVDDTVTVANTSYHMLINQASISQLVGVIYASAGSEYQGFLADFYFIDGSIIAPSSFGEFVYNTWVPNEYTGSYGLNGFHLDFADDTDFGKDVSGNANHFTENTGSLLVQTLDTPTNNYPTWDTVTESPATVSDAGIHVVTPSATREGIPITVPFPQSGTWRVGLSVTSVAGAPFFGLVEATHDFGATCHTQSDTYLYYSFNGNKWSGGSDQGVYGNTWGASDVVDLVYNSNTGQLEFFKNGISQGVAFTLDTDKTYVAVLSDAATANSAAGDLENGAEGFTYTITSAKALNTKNFPNPAVVDSDLGLWIKEHTGTGADADITGSSFSLVSGKQLIWSKNRDTIEDHHLADTYRAKNIVLNPDFSGYTGTAPTLDFAGWLEYTVPSGGTADWSYDNGGKIEITDNTTTSRFQQNIPVRLNTNYTIDYTIAGGAGNFSPVEVTVLQGGSPYATLATSGQLSSDGTDKSGSMSFDSGANASIVVLLEFSYGPPAVGDILWARNVVIQPTSPVPTTELYSNDDAIGTVNAEGVTALLTNGFSVGDGTNGFNASGDAYINWVLNMLPKYGMDIVQYVGTGAVKYTSHSIGIPPELIIIKSLSNPAHNWMVGCEYMDATSPWSYFMQLNTTAAKASGGFGNTTQYWNQFGIGSHSSLNTANDSYVAHLFAPIPGFLKIGYWIGNGSTDGPRIYTGFRPRYLLVKDVDGTYSWRLIDNVRSTYNDINEVLYPNVSNVEATIASVDFLSNGFKIRDADDGWNHSGNRHIYMAIGDPYPYVNAL